MDNDLQTLDDFIKETVEEGFIQINNDKGTKIPDSQLMYMDRKSKEKHEQDLATTPQVVLFHPKTNVLVEVYAEKGIVKQAFGITKYKSSSLRDNLINNSFNNMIEGDEILHESEYKGCTFEHLRKIELKNSDDVYEINYILEQNADYIEPLKLDFNEQELNCLTFMEKTKGMSPRDKVNELNDILGDQVDNIITAKSGMKFKLKNR